MSSTLSPEQAAKRAGLSRWTISRALQAGRLRGIRDNRGRWRIEAEDLDAWRTENPPAPAGGLHSEQPALHAEQHTLPTVQVSAENGFAHHALTTEIAVLRVRIEAAEERAAELVHERDEARTERDHWRAMAERLAEPKPRLGLLSRLLGQSQPRTV